MALILEVKVLFVAQVAGSDSRGSREAPPYSIRFAIAGLPIA
jgi:hypothetical protein